MKKYVAVFMAVCLVFALGLAGCSKKAASSSSAIETSKSMKTVEEQVNYLISQANAFYNSKDFQNAVDIAQYILQYLDKDSNEAQDLLEKAKKALLENVPAELKDKIGDFGK